MKSQFWNSKSLNYGSWMLLIMGMLLGSYLLSSNTTSVDSPQEIANVQQVSSEPDSRLGADVGHIPIEDIKVGMRVLARNPEISDEERATWTEPNWADYFHLSLVMPKPDGSELHIEMLRSEEWVRSHIGYLVQIDEQTLSEPSCVYSLGDVSNTSSNYVLRPFFQDLASSIDLAQRAGANIEYLTIQLDLPEFRFAGEAFILEIQPCCRVKLGAGEVVTATFHHSSGDAVDLIVQNDDGRNESIGTTVNHPFWSVDRKAFIPVGELKAKERVVTYSSKIQTVVQHSTRAETDVFNLEINNEHVYFVGNSGTLVHNSCPDGDGLIEVFRGGRKSP